MSVRSQNILSSDNALSASDPYSSIGFAIAFLVLDRLKARPDLHAQVAGCDVYDITDFILTFNPDGHHEGWTIDMWIEEFAYMQDMYQLWPREYDEEGEA